MMRLTPLLAMLLPASQAPPPTSTLPSPPPGWRVEVVAEAPVVNHPTVVCCAPDGRVFVAEDPMDISVPADAELGRILCFSPDGEVSTFASGLHAVFGMQFLEGKLYVLHNPRYTAFEASGRVAGGRTDLIHSTLPNPWDHDWNDHVPANFKLAMDGYFYVSVGDKGLYGAVGADGARIDMHGGGILRMRPGATELEIFSTGTRNHLDVAVNLEDDLFTYDNTDEIDWWSRVTHMVEGGYYGYPWDHKPAQPFILPAMTDYGAGAATAFLSYDEDALPQDYRGDLWLADWGRRELFRLKVERAGATYRVARRIDFVTNAPADFRPVGMAFAPDGLTLWVSDWRHPDFKAQVDAGRLLKFIFTAPGSATEKPAWYVGAALGKSCAAPQAELLAALRHPSRAVRIAAQRELARRGAEAAPGLAGLARDESAPPQARHHALWAIDAAEGKTGGAHSVFTGLLKSTEPSVKAQAVRAVGLRRVREAVPGLEESLRGADANLRRLSACALGRIGEPGSVTALLEALGQEDLFARQAAWTAIHSIASAHPSAWAGVVRALSSKEARIREGAAFALRNAHDEQAIQALKDLSRRNDIPAPERAAALRALLALCRKPPEWKGDWWVYHPVQLPRPVKTVDWAGTAAILASLIESMSSPEAALRRAAVEAAFDLRESSALPQLRKLALEDPDIETRKSALRTLAGLKDTAAAQEIARLLNSPDTPLEVLPEAVTAAERIGGAELARALASLARTPARCRGLEPRILAAIGRLGVVETTDSIVPFLEDPREPVRKSAAAALGNLKGSVAFEALLRSFSSASESARLDLAAALAQMPDLRALDAYCLGLSGSGPASRQPFRSALATLRDGALPVLEERARRKELDRQVLLELRKIWADPKPLPSWRVLGPRDRLEAAPIGALEGTGVAGWPELLALEGGIVDLDRMLTPGSRAVAWAHAEVEAPTAAYGDLQIGSRGAITVWWNGAKAIESPVSGRITDILDRVPVKLEAGRNRMLIRVEESGGGAAFIVKAPTKARGLLFEEDLKEPDPRGFLDAAFQGKGDPGRGREVFQDTRRTSCLKCHAIKGVGGKVGPDLGGVGSQYDRAALVESVLYPSKAVRPGYEQTTIVTGSGEVRIGVLKGETADSVLLADAEGAEWTIPKGDIAQRETSPISLMPEGVTTGLTPAEFADLIAFLEGLRG